MEQLGWRPFLLDKSCCGLIAKLCALRVHGEAEKLEFELKNDIAIINRLTWPNSLMKGFAF